MVSAELLREARRQVGISQAELGRRSGVAPSLIGRYERGEVVPSLERLRGLVAACGLELTFALAELRDEQRLHTAREARRTPGERLRSALAGGRAQQTMAAHGSDG